VTGAGSGGLTLLAVDDEGPALSELVNLLRRNNLVEQVLFAHSGDEALRMLRSRRVDGVFLDIRMPGPAGLELAGVLGQFRDPPPVAFVSAFEGHAVDAFELQALDYLRKPVGRRRLEEAEESLRAIRDGEVDAIIVTGTKGDRVFSLAETENLHRLMVETMNEAGIATSPDGVILYCNQRTAALLQRSTSELVGRPLEEFIAPQDATRVSAFLREAAGGTVNMLCSDRYTDMGEGATYQSTWLEVGPWTAQVAEVA